MRVVLNWVYDFWWVLSGIIFISITVLSLSPLDKLPEAPGSDKLHHLIAYASLIFPVALRKAKNWVWIGAFFIAWSGGIELVQPYVNRYGEVEDFVANFLGVSLGFLAARVFARLDCISDSS